MLSTWPQSDEAREFDNRHSPFDNTHTMIVDAPPISPLSALNADLARFFGRPLLGFTLGADHALADDLVICGILGGKDIGKSTLINALAGTRVSVDESEVGRGTDRPRAYVHRSRRDALLRRLSNSGARGDVDLVLHDAENIANVVLVDLPDFDSEFLDHLQIVQRVAPRLDRVLWVQSPRKLGDRAWVGMLHDVVKDFANVHLVLNKVDELLADSEPFEKTGDGALTSDMNRAEAFWTAQRRWVADAIVAAGCDLPDERIYLVAGLYPDSGAFTARIAHRWDDPAWQRFESDRVLVQQIAGLATRDLEQLRAAVIGPIQFDRARQIKTANQSAEQRTWAVRLDEHFGVTLTRDLLEAAVDPDYHQAALNDAFGSGYCDQVGERVSTQLRGDGELADELLSSRVDRWPLLRLAYFPLGWLSRMMGRQWSLLRGLASPRANLEHAWEVDHRTLGDRVALYRERLRGDRAALVAELHMEDFAPHADRLTDRLTAAVGALPAQVERELIEDLRFKDRKPSFIGRGLLWLVFLWFPILQPVAAGILEMMAAGETWDLVRGLARIVAALSAVHLLAGFAVVAIIFALLIAGMYARCLKDIRRRRSETVTADALAQRIDSLLLAEVASPLLQPYLVKRQEVEVLSNRLQQLTAPRCAA